MYHARLNHRVARVLLPRPQVTRSGLTNACSIAGIMLTTQAVMTEQKREKKPNLGMSAGGMPAGLTM